MATITAAEPTPAGMKKIFLNSYDGSTYRLVSTRPARDCTPDEIPIVDLSALHGSDLAARKTVARSILHAAKTSGFFYIKNHGISEGITEASYRKGLDFFKLPEGEKRKLTSNTSAYGYAGFRERQANPGETRDRKEAFMCHYEPEFDPLHEGRLDQVPANVRQHLPKEDFSWTDQGDTAVLSGLKSAILSHWRACLGLSRQLIRVIALALDLPEDYFDPFTTYPGGDFAINFYPGHGDDPVKDPEEVGVGAHTDLQILTLLWQDKHKGLQVLNSAGEWMWAPPIPGTFVVNIGDFFMRMTNDQLKSTVHRVVQHGREDRISMPFFFGFNFDQRLGVLPTCVDEQNPAKYEPVACGELIAKRLALAEIKLQ
ncbi:putative iron/ascorbate oxidoreductase-like protein 1 [Colletotrichum chlorophyti]|uniref:Putative iron/ascorbate oxidoreductase-like protein 1 n=1 Tax=Colletotrichum chlorophyti TaxID=708187 RepID=A0A1Q8S3B0_9PEZI|nr:putative iron/ascorbate oxidoreductase-like protein 1 [Colletotrichum chlorophyti]